MTAAAVGLCDDNAEADKRMTEEHASYEENKNEEDLESSLIPGKGIRKSKAEI